MKFGDLVAGDVMSLAGITSVVMAVQEHPLNDRFLLIVWYVWGPNRGWVSFDMLHPDVELIPGSSVYKDGFKVFNRAVREAAG